MRAKDTFYIVITSVGTTRGQGIIRVVVVVLVAAFFSDILIFWKIVKVKKGPTIDH